MKVIAAIGSMSLFLLSCKKHDAMPSQVKLSKSSATTSGIGETDLFWRINSDGSSVMPGKRVRLRVKFLPSNEPIKRRLFRAAAREWEKHAYVDFVFVNEAQPAEIRVSFNEKEHSRALIGTGALGYPDTAATINIGVGLPYTTYRHDDEEYDHKYNLFYGAILHELGHVLGLVDEHQHPDANIKWKQEFVADMIAQDSVMGYNYFKKRDFLTCSYGKYDSQSIMHNDATADQIDAGEVIDASCKLSPGDIDFIGTIYPYPVQHTRPKAKKFEERREDIPFFCLGGY